MGDNAFFPHVMHVFEVCMKYIGGTQCFIEHDADSITGSVPREFTVSVFWKQSAKYNAKVFWWF